MKAMLFAALFLVPFIAEAKEDFALEFIDKSVIVDNTNDWVFVAAEGKVYNLYVSKDAIAAGETRVPLHSKVEFLEKDGFKFDALQQPIKRIFSFGIIDCENAALYLITDFFVDSNNKIVHMQEHEPGDYIVEMLTPNTPRNSLYKAVCNIK